MAWSYVVRRAAEHCPEVSPIRACLGSATAISPQRVTLTDLGWCGDVRVRSFTQTRRNSTISSGRRDVACEVLRFAPRDQRHFG